MPAFMTVSRPAALLLAGAVLLLAACGEGPERAAIPDPQPIQAGEECHVCGMIVSRFPGPKGEVFVPRQEQAFKFCSTRDLFAWLLQPDSAALVQAVYVHDMAQTDWDHPDDTRLIDAREAWYVAGSGRRGAMGPTLASFRERENAEAFARTEGGHILRYEDIDLEVLADLEEKNTSMAGHAMHNHAGMEDLESASQ